MRISAPFSRRCVAKECRNVWPALLARGFHDFLISLRQRIRSHEHAHGQDGHPRIWSPNKALRHPVPLMGWSASSSSRIMRRSNQRRLQCHNAMCRALPRSMGLISGRTSSTSWRWAPTARSSNGFGSDGIHCFSSSSGQNPRLWGWNLAQGLSGLRGRSRRSGTRYG